MTTFTLDTSGFVSMPEPFEPSDLGAEWAWPDLSPFAQGYVEALLQGEARRDGPGSVVFVRPIKGFAFSDLAPKTLALILKDCADARRRYMRDDTTKDGRLFWEARDKGDCQPEGYWPLTPYLGDDGKVYLRETA